METRIPEIGVEELRSRQQAGERLCIIDVRREDEFESGHAETAHLIPLDRITGEEVERVRRETGAEEVYVICRSGARSQRAIEILRGEGLGRLTNVRGGTLAWMAAGYPVRTGR